MAEVAVRDMAVRTIMVTANEIRRPSSPLDNKREHSRRVEVEIAVSSACRGSGERKDHIPASQRSQWNPVRD